MHVIGWQEIALRLALTVIAGFLIGVDRSEHDRPAGMRTTLLVCLAASISMIEANILMTTVGKASNSYVSMDVMRLPLGILTGVGFIGAGAIVRRNDLVLGVTTAATIWFVTVVGLCFGGGQLWLGVVGTILALLVLSALRVVEMHMRQKQVATLIIRAAATGPGTADLCNRLRAAGLVVTKVREMHNRYPGGGEQATGGVVTRQFSLRWLGFREDPTVPPVIRELAILDGVHELDWRP